MRGTIYGIGVGPGDPELMTLKAVRLIEETNVIAVPGKTAASSTAYQIAVQAVPELEKKELVPVSIPMTKNRAAAEQAHKKGADILKQYLDKGENVAYLTIGDPAIYCSFSYIQRILEDEGYQTQMVSGVPSFCAAAARLNEPLVSWDEPLHVIPAAHSSGINMDQPGSFVLMKSARNMRDVKRILRGSGRTVDAVINCGLNNEMVYHNLEDIPDDIGYYSLLVAKEANG